MVRQSFDIFNIYGKDPASIENIILGFSIALEDVQTEDFVLAFKEWMKKSATMPTPADINTLAMENKVIRQRKESPKRPAGNAYQLREPEVEQKFPWAMKYYSEAIEDGSVQAFFDHWLPQDEDKKKMAYEWLVYAYDYLRYPAGISEAFAKQAGVKTRPIFPIPASKNDNSLELLAQKILNNPHIEK